MKYINENVDLVVVVDAGKNSIKITVYNNKYEALKQFSFPSKVKQVRNFRKVDSSDERQNRIEFVNKETGKKEYYVVGAGLSTEYNLDTTKNNSHTILCIYTAISKAISSPMQKIRLVVGYPSTDYSNPEKAKDFEDLLNTGLSIGEPIEVKVNDEEKSFKIESYGIYPEGIAFKPRNENNGRPVRVVDIGGQNTNYRHYDTKSLLNSFSLDKAGVNHLGLTILSELREIVDPDKIDIYSINLLEAIKRREMPEVEEYMENAGYADSEEFMDDVVKTFIEDNIFQGIKSKGANLMLRGHLIIFVGGGSLLLKPYLIELLNETNEDNMLFSKTAQWDNCISYVITDIVTLSKELKTEVAMNKARLLIAKVLKQAEDFDLENYSNEL